MSGRHVDPVEMVEYARGELGGADGTALLEHCESCEECGNQLAAVLLLRRSRVGARRHGHRRWLAVAAAIVLAVAAGVVGASLLGPSDADDPLTSAAAGVDSAVATSEVADLAVRRIDDSWLQVYRQALDGATTTPVGAGDEAVTATLKAALVALDEGTPGHAVELLTACCGSDPAHPWARLLLGVAHFAHGADLDAAADALEDVLDRPAGQGERAAAAWFLANTRLLQGRPGAASRLLQSVAPEAPFAEEAAALLDRIEAGSKGTSADR